MPTGRERVAASEAEPLDFRTYSLHLQAWPMLQPLLSGQEDHSAGRGVGGDSRQTVTARYLVWQLYIQRVREVPVLL